MTTIGSRTISFGGNRSAVAVQFENLLRSTSEEKKLLATKLTLNYLKVARWDENEPDYADVYATAWIEKKMLVDMAYGVNEILEISKELRKQNYRLLADVGLIVARTGEILKNQEVIIAQNGDILAIVEDIQTDVKEIKTVSYEILGNVKDIKASVEDMQNNGVRVIKNNYKGGGGFANYMPYLIVAGIILAVLVYLKRKGKKGGK